MFAPDHTTFFVTGSHVFITNHTLHTLPLLMHPRPFFSPPASCAPCVYCFCVSCVDAPKRRPNLGAQAWIKDLGIGPKSTFVVYIIRVQRIKDGASCVSSRRYSELRSLYNHLKVCSVCVRSREGVFVFFLSLFFWRGLTALTTTTRPAGRPMKARRQARRDRQTQAGY